MNKLIILSAFFCIAVSCNKIEEKKNELKTSMAEKVIEAASGKEIDALDVNNIEKNSSVVEVEIDGKNISKDFENGFGNITASKETIAITVTGGENGQDNILLGFTGKDLTTERPIKGKMVKGENAGFTFSTMRLVESGMEALISMEAEGEIISMNEEKTVIRLKGKLSNTLDAENPEKWKSYEGTITLNYPIFQALGSSKEDFIY